MKCVTYVISLKFFVSTDYFSFFLNHLKGLHKSLFRSYLQVFLLYWHTVSDCLMNSWAELRYLFVYPHSYSEQKSLHFIAIKSQHHTNVKRISLAKASIGQSQTQSCLPPAAYLPVSAYNIAQNYFSCRGYIWSPVSYSTRRILNQSLGLLRSYHCNWKSTFILYIRCILVYKTIIRDRKIFYRNEASINKSSYNDNC